MTALVNRFALVGRSYPSDTFEQLRKASVEARIARRTARISRANWGASAEALVLPKRLFA